MIGEGEYNLNALREIRVTQSFLEMEEMDRGCQIVETIQDCSTRHHINSLTEECICLPLSLGLQLFEKVCDDWTIEALLLYFFSLRVPYLSVHHLRNLSVSTKQKLLLQLVCHHAVD